MADLARLVVEIDASQADAAKRKLEDLGASAVNLERSTTAATRGTKTASDGIKGMSDSVTKATNSFGLAGHQVKNLTAQVVDFGVQVSSGGGFLLPIIQQGPQAIEALGGVSGAITAAGQALLRFGGLLGPIAAGVTALVASIKADGAVRDMERLADRFAILQNRFGRGLSGSDVQDQLDGIMSAAQRTGVSFNSLATAQRDFIEATQRGGSLTKNGVFGIDVGTMQQSTDAVELLARGLEAAGVSAGDAGPMVEAFFSSIRKDGTLSAKVLEDIMTVAPKFAKPLIDSLGGASSLFYRLSQGAKIGGKDAVNAIIGIQKQIEQLEKQHIPSVGAAFSKVGGQADTAFKKIGLAIGGEGVSFASLMAQAVLRIGDGFVYIGQQAASFVASVNSVLAPINAMASGLGAVLEKVTGLQNFTSPAKMFEATKAEIDKIILAFDTLTQKSVAFQSLSDPPTFLKNTIAEIEKILGLIDKALAFAGRVGGYFGSNQTAASQMREAGLGPLVPDPGARGEGSWGPDQYGPLLSEMEKQTSLQQTFRDAVNAGADAAKQGATATQQNTEAAERGFSGLTGTVTNGIGVWKGGNDAVKSGVETNTKTNAAGFKAVQDTLRAVGSGIIGAVSQSTAMKDGRGFTHAATSNEDDLAWQIATEKAFRAATDGGMTFYLGRMGSGTLQQGGGAGMVGTNRPGGSGGFLGGKMAAPSSSEEFAAMRDAALGENAGALDAITRTLGTIAAPALNAVADPMTASDTPRIDPYKDRNPDYFYNNTTGQVHKGKTDAEVLRTLPKDIAKEIAEALVKAGLVGERIGEAIVQAGTRPTAAPSPQDGWLPNRGPIRGNYGPGIYN